MVHFNYWEWPDLAVLLFKWGREGASVFGGVFAGIGGILILPGGLAAEPSFYGI